jgi:hypothetical protein
MSPNTSAPGGEVPGDFVATVGGTDGLVPPPWRASYVISVSMTGGVRLMYAIDHAAVLPCSWRVPVGMRRRRALARLVLSCGIFGLGTDASGLGPLVGGQRSGVWLCASVGSVRRALPLNALLGGPQVEEAFRAAVSASVWRRVAERRTEFLTAHQSPGLRGRLGGEAR